MDLPLYQIDAFTTQPFGGNPAAVCPLERWIDDDLMQRIAAENNLSETAFFVDDGADPISLRWFTPAAEIDLCGHATLAAGHLVLETLGSRSRSVAFSTASGILEVTRESDRLMMELPSWPAEPVEPPAALAAGIRDLPETTLRAKKNYLLVYETEDEVRAVSPDMEPLRSLHPHGVIVTAPGRDHDFVSRYFAPSWGVPEDPATGSAHCTLTPYWSERLGKTGLSAYQASARGARIECEHRGDRVGLGGSCATYLVGTIRV